MAMLRRCILDLFALTATTASRESSSSAKVAVTTPTDVYTTIARETEEVGMVTTSEAVGVATSSGEDASELATMEDTAGHAPNTVMALL